MVDTSWRAVRWFGPIGWKIQRQTASGKKIDRLFQEGAIFGLKWTSWFKKDAERFAGCLNASDKVGAVLDSAINDGCICKGNWRILVEEYGHLLGRKYRNQEGSEYTFFGLVWAEDDLYYGMWRQSGMRLLSCVGSPEGFGFELIPED